jgi:polyisoprenoid-binding protein YceI
LLTVLLFTAACGGSSEPTPDPTPEPVAAPTQAPMAESAPAADAPGTEPVEGTPMYAVTSDSTATYIVQEEFLADALSKLGINAGKTEVFGVSQEVGGFIQLDLNNLDNALGPNQFTVDLTVLQTDQSRRDNWIQENGPTFGRFPLASFEATSIVGAPQSYTEGQEASFQLVGNLTIREITQPATFDVTATLADRTIRGTATADLLMSDFGIDPPSFANTLTVEDGFQIVVNLVAVGQ